uniref:Uncharacterized protein n=1 Tax=Zea mays TaxID=4577 RepID=C4J2P2_MAIZE|nr:unknown [Zea mays]
MHSQCSIKCPAHASMESLFSTRCPTTPSPSTNCRSWRFPTSRYAARRFSSTSTLLLSGARST